MNEDISWVVSRVSRPEAGISVGQSGYKFGVLRTPNLYPSRAPVTPLITDVGSYSPTYNQAYILVSSAGRQS